MSMINRTPGIGQQGRVAPLCRFTSEVLASENVVPVVLEFNQPPVAVYTRQNPQADADKYQAELAEAHRAFLARLASTGMDVQLGSTSVVVAGPTGTSTVTMPHDFTVVFNGVGVLMPGKMVAEVAQMAGVRAVTHNHERVYLNMNTNRSIPFTGAPQIWSRLDSAGRGIKGEGVTVAIIDTGVF